LFRVSLSAERSAKLCEKAPTHPIKHIQLNMLIDKLKRAYGDINGERWKSRIIVLLMFRKCERKILNYVELHAKSALSRDAK